MRTTIMAALVAITLTGFAGAANALQWNYVAPTANGTCPAGSFYQPAQYGHHTHWVDARCAVGPR